MTFLTIHNPLPTFLRHCYVTSSSGTISSTSEQMMMYVCLRKLAVPTMVFLASLLVTTAGFSLGGLGRSFTTRTIQDRFVLRQSSSSNTVIDEVDAMEDIEKEKERKDLKCTILQLGASYDRGFAASPRVRSKMEDTLRDLELLNQETYAARFVDGPPSTSQSTTSTTSSTSTIGCADDAASSSSSLEISPLTGNWRMVWTTAQDVLVLGANPVVSVGAIYQFIDPPTVTNVIDFFPRIQSFLPPSLVPNSMLRAEVTTKASSRKSYPNRVGLNFERVELQGKEILGRDVSQWLPPLGLDLPRIDLSQDVGYFDVTYLDSELLVIRQNSPGGCFVLVNVGTDTDP